MNTLGRAGPRRTRTSFARLGTSTLLATLSLWTALSLLTAAPLSAAPADKPVDYWRQIHFDRKHFQQVRRYVQRYYIYGTTNEKLAWIGAANGALGRLQPPLELLPSTWFTARRDLPNERARLGGKTTPFLCHGQQLKDLVLHGKPPESAQSRAMNKADLETWLRQRRREEKRQRSLRRAWSKSSFGPREMGCALRLAKTRLSLDPVSPPAQGTATEALTAPPKTAPKPRTPAPFLAPPADKNRLWIAATNGYLGALDPHSTLIPKAAWDHATQETQDASFEGIGAIMTWHNGQTTVENPMRGLPAHRAGLRSGDVIVSVDGQAVAGLQLAQVVALIRGKRDTVVRLVVARPGQKKKLKIKVIRSRVEIKNVSGELLPDHPGFIVVRVTGFVPQTTLNVRAMILKLRRQLPDKTLQGLVLDLRGNGGGLLDEAIALSDMFLDHGRIVSIHNRASLTRGEEEELHEARRQPGWDLDFPMIVLMNDSSASASEILAAALQDNGRALITGLRSFGKGSVQRLFQPTLRGDYYLKLTVARYHTPTGRSIQLTGVTPDMKLPPEPDGRFPVGFREEDLAEHLSATAPPSSGPLAKVVPALTVCVQRSGVAWKVLKRDRDAALRPDFQLLRSADYLRCLARLQHGR